MAVGVGTSRDKQPSQKERLELVEQKVEILHHYTVQLIGKVQELDARLQRFENQNRPDSNGDDKAFWKLRGELNGLDARVAELERPEVEDDPK